MRINASIFLIINLFIYVFFFFSVNKDYIYHVFFQVNTKERKGANIRLKFPYFSIFNPRSIESAKNTVASFMKNAFAQQNISTTAIICSAVVGLFAYEQYVYLKKKKSLPGPVLKIPIIGAFMDSLYPTFEGYMNKWKSGELSCVSVFDR